MEIEDAVQALIQDKRVISLGKVEANNKLYTTQARLDIEGQMIACADKLAEQINYKLEDNSIGEAIQEQTRHRGFALSDEQVEAEYSSWQSGLDNVRRGWRGKVNLDASNTFSI